MTTPQLDLEQVKYFIKILTGSEVTPVTWQVYYDPKGALKRPDLAAHFVATLDQALPTLTRSQSQMCGVYIGINETDGKGRKIENIKSYRAVFADFDGMAQPQWPIMPHLVQERDATHGHAIWLCDDITDVKEFRSLQYRIHLNKGTDYQVTDPSRVLRAPGTTHYKDPSNPARYRITGDGQQVLGTQHRYKKAEIEAAFPLTADQEVVLDRWVNSRDSIGTGSGFEDTQVSRDRLIKFLQIMAEPAIQGSGTYTVIRSCSMGYDLGLPLEVTQELAWQHYNPRCMPPWGEHEKEHFYQTVGNAYQFAKNEPGCRTAKASFASLPPVPAPPAPKTEVELVRNGDRLDNQAARIMTPMLTAKSSHYELAQALDGVLYDGTNVIRCEKIWYEFNGKSWKLKSDNVMKAEVQRFYSRFKPSDTLTAGIYKVLSDLVNVSSIENGTWLNTGNFDEGIVCFRNGLVDLSKPNPVVMDHTPNFFTFNELQYDYEPNANCPNWIKFLRNIWDYDLKLIEQLQEFMGYCLISNVDLQKFALFVGKSRAGKGTISGVLRTLVGDANTASPALASLIKDSSLHKLSTASVGFIPDAHSVTPSKRDEVLSMFKALTGGDPVDYHVMYKGTHTSKFRIKFILSTNGMPEFVDPSGALANRMLVFPFLKSFAGNEDVTLSDSLMKECAGIAQWALKGLTRLNANGRFTEAESGLREKECIREDMSPLSRFIDDICVTDENAFTAGDDLYRIYTLWAKQHNVLHPLSQTKIIRELNSSSLNIVQDRARVISGGNPVRGFKGLKLVKFAPVEKAVN
ncbi:P-loop containing nucleoside triphosphate hydrolase [Vibrio phage 1.049.O._10N.286.54.B5]|nr:P-loop containing nucleoside triphosphate hydrolase [Vibrio phage 1.049.O._10N.286.54.B5]AUR84207.1 P-loop containing nucleoside triphosphate hydrolase [Vibrio phage 1.050.O._10N.286.48.A6]